YRIALDQRRTALYSDTDAGGSVISGNQVANDRWRSTRDVDSRSPEPILETVRYCETGHSGTRGLSVVEGDYAACCAAIDLRNRGPSGTCHEDGFALEVDVLNIRAGVNQHDIAIICSVDRSLNRSLIGRYMDRVLGSR